MDHVLYGVLAQSIDSYKYLYIECPAYAVQLEHSVNSQ